jgi:hypothetical protein
MSRRALVMGLGVAATSAGCGMNPFLMIQHLASGGDDRMPADFPLKPQAKKQDAKVVVIAWSKPGLPTNLAGVDRMLNAELIRVLDMRVKENDEKVQVLKMQVIDKFKEDNPNWRKVHPCDFGKQFGADYVIDVEIVEMDLFKQGSREQWLLGHAVVAVDAYDLSKPIREPSFKQDFTYQYPNSEQPVENRSDISTFRMAFVQRVASNISVKFSASSPQKQMDGLTITAQ